MAARHASLLRKMSKDISEHCFAPGSAFTQFVRLGPGALVALASTRLLNGEAVGGERWRNVPVWARAFVASFGIELIFGFVNRITDAFAAKGP
jgi:hypothetical protein